MTQEEKIKAAFEKRYPHYEPEELGMALCQVRTNPLDATSCLTEGEAMNELIQRLRLHARVLNEQEHAMLSQDCTKAADMIEQQAGEFEQMRAVAAEMAEALEEAMYSNSTEIAIKKSGEALGKWKELNK